MSTLFRLLVAAFVCIAPTALFLGLWHGLQRMQNGELVERVAANQGVTVEDLVPGANPYATREVDPTDQYVVPPDHDRRP
ncbi:hypothetical protein [Halococcus salsus]|uniref:hypothetical protein n=1 Tax=Halococcus salsus TaxID=2162894 RepID=UPI001357F234|nr:hypothetical protein [Halococcus salsus]